MSEYFKLLSDQKLIQAIQTDFPKPDNLQLIKQHTDMINPNTELKQSGIEVIQLLGIEHHDNDLNDYESETKIAAASNNPVANLKFKMKKVDLQDKFDIRAFKGTMVKT